MVMNMVANGMIVKIELFSGGHGAKMFHFYSTSIYRRNLADDTPQCPIYLIQLNA